MSKEQIDLESVVESIIFVSAEPISKDKIQKTCKEAGYDFDTRDISSAINSLLEKWSNKDRELGKGMVLRKIAGGLVFLSSPQNAQITQKVIDKKPYKLSKAQVEVLAIVAYRQPITRVDIDDIRSVDSSFAIKKLLSLKLLKILGKSEGLGRPLLYGTTKEFLEFFSLNSLNDLPTLKEYEVLDEHAAQDVDLNDNNLKLKDLFKEAEKKGMFSKDVEQLSEEALKNLDDALLNINDVEEKNIQK